jgi:very-short-patch-repair endonuclease
MPSLVVVRAQRTCARIAAEQSFVLGRRQAKRLGVPRWYLDRELRAGRWQRTGRQTVVMHNAPLEWRTRCWVAVLEAAPRAALDGVTSLRWEGLPLEDEEIVLITPKGSRSLRLTGVRVRESRRWAAGDIRTVGIRRTSPAVAAVHAGLWAVTDKQAAYFPTLAVQKGIATPAQLADVLAAVRRARRRAVLVRTVSDLAGGSRTLQEIDLAKGLRERGLPAPDRQSIRKRPSGTQFLDADFDDYDLTLELDGEQHSLPTQKLADLFRDLALVVEGRTVLRIPNSAWWLAREALLDALEEVFAARGWRRAA